MNAPKTDAPAHDELKASLEGLYELLANRRGSDQVDSLVLWSFFGYLNGWESMDPDFVAKARYGLARVIHYEHQRRERVS